MIGSSSPGHAANVVALIEKHKQALKPVKQARYEQFYNSQVEKK
jgi:hypothetical protein